MPERTIRLEAVSVLAASIVACLLLALWIPTLLTPELYPAPVTCWRGNETLLRIHDLGNLAMWIEYVSIPALVMAAFLRARAFRVARAFPVLAAWGCGFVLLCGGTHLMSRTELWRSMPTTSGRVLWVAVSAGAIFIGLLVWRFGSLVLWLTGLRISQHDTEA